MNDSVFEIFGYKKSYIVRNKFMGSVNLSEPDREKTGHEGMREEILQEDLVTDKKKLLPKGTVCETILIPLCGRMKKRFEPIRNDYYEQRRN